MPHSESYRLKKYFFIRPLFRVEEKFNQGLGFLTLWCFFFQILDIISKMSLNIKAQIQCSNKTLFFKKITPYFF